MSISQTFAQESYAGRSGTLSGSIWGKDIASMDEGFACLGHLARGNRSAFERDAAYAIGIKVQHGALLATQPRQVDARTLKEEQKQSPIREAFAKGKAAGRKASVEVKTRGTKIGYAPG